MDDDYYDAVQYYPTPRLLAARARPARRGARLPVGEPAGRERDLLALRHHERGHRPTTRTTSSSASTWTPGVGGSRLSCDGIYESDDDNAFWDKSSGLEPGLHLGRFGHGVDRTSNCGRTGYLGYAYLETPGNPFDGIDNDDDGITDERATAGPARRSSGRPRSAHT
jgi:hypothetical protein